MLVLAARRILYSPLQQTALIFGRLRSVAFFPGTSWERRKACQRIRQLRRRWARSWWTLVVISHRCGGAWLETVWRQFVSAQCLRGWPLMLLLHMVPLQSRSATTHCLQALTVPQHMRCLILCVRHLCLRPRMPPAT